MAFLVPHHPLKPRRRLAVELDPAARIVRAADLATWFDAEQAIAAAQSQADQIVADARATLESERQRGYAEGKERARREAAQHMAEQLLRTKEYFSRVEDRLVDLVMQATRRIVEGYSDPERVVHTVRNALALVRNQKHMTVRLNPAQVDHVRARVDELLVGYPGVELFDVVADANVGSDACVLESDIGIVEASTDGQLAALQAALRNALGAGPADDRGAA